MVMPGDNVAMTVELGKPIAMDEGLRFAIREGGRTVGAGRVTKILKPPSPKDGESYGEEREAGEDHPRVHRVQAAELHHDEVEDQRP